MKTEVTYGSTGCGNNVVRLESIDVVSKMTSRRIYAYVEAVRDDMYRCESIEGPNSEQYKTIHNWVMDVYKILNKRGHSLPR